MYEYGEVYDKVIRNTRAVNLPDKESIKIVDKIYNDLEIGILKPRNINKKCNKLICNSLARQNDEDDCSMDKYQVNAFIDNIRPKLKISDSELNDLRNSLLNLEDKSTDAMTTTLKDYLFKTNNKSLKMIKNQDFRTFNQAFITLEHPKCTEKYGVSEDYVLLYSYIDHDYGILFKLLTDESHLLTKSEVDEEIIKEIERENPKASEYDDIRNLKIIDEFRDLDNPDIITVLFIKEDETEYLKVKLESMIESKLLGVILEDSEKIKGLKKGTEVLVSYCFDYTDNIHVYVDADAVKVAGTVKEVSNLLKNPTKEGIVETLSKYKYINGFDIIVDTFHSVIFNYFKDINEFYSAIRGH